MAKRVVASVGTKRGLFLLESGPGRKSWKVTGPLLKGWSVPYALVDTRGTSTIHAGASHFAFGYSLRSAPLRTRKFTAAEKMPEFPRIHARAAKFAKQYGLDMGPKIRLLAPGPANRKKVLHLGTAPAGLFRSDDSGRTWSPVDGLNRHRTRKDWSPGAGGRCLHRRGTAGPSWRRAGWCPRFFLDTDPGPRATALFPGPPGSGKGGAGGAGDRSPPAGAGPRPSSSPRATRTRWCCGTPAASGK